MSAKIKMSKRVRAYARARARERMRRGCVRAAMREMLRVRCAVWRRYDGAMRIAENARGVEMRAAV